MRYEFLAEVNQKTVKEAYNLYLDSYLNWGNPVPFNFDEFKEVYTKSNAYEPALAFFDDDVFVGYGVVMSNNLLHKRLDLGFCVVKKHRNKGYATEIVKHLINFVNKKFAPNLILADTFGNPASERVLAKSGFKEGGLIPDFNLATGEPRNLKMFYLKT